MAITWLPTPLPVKVEPLLPPTRNVCDRQDTEDEVGSVAVAVDRPMKNIKKEKKQMKEG